MKIEAKLDALGLTLSEKFTPPAGTVLPFSWVRVRGNRAYISGHAPQNPDGSLAQPLGRVGAEVSLEEAYQAARLIALSMLGSLKRELGDLVACSFLSVLALHYRDLPFQYASSALGQS
jgi:hypothetical protein